MKPSRKQRTAPKVFVDGPAVLSPLHVMDRPATDKDGKPITGTAAYRKLTPFQATCKKGQLQGGSRHYTAADRQAAGDDYTKIFDAAETAVPGSMARLLTGAGGSGGSSSDAQAKAKSELACIHSHMGERDRKIIIMVCGHGHWPVEAVRDVCGDYRDTVSARFREAMDALCDAMEASRRAPGRIDMRRRA